MSVRVGSEFDLAGVDRAAATYEIDSPAGTSRGSATIWHGLDDFTGESTGFFIEAEFPDVELAGTYRLVVDLTVPAHWRCPKYDPAGCSWVSAASAHREYGFTFVGYPAVSEVAAKFAAPIIYTHTVASTATRSATATAKESVKVTVKRHGVRVTKRVKARATVTKKASARASASGTGYSLAEAETAASKAAGAKAGSAASAAATKLAKKAAAKKAKKKAKRLAKKKALKAAARHTSR